MEPVGRVDDKQRRGGDEKAGEDAGRDAARGRRAKRVAEGRDADRKSAPPAADAGEEEERGTHDEGRGPKDRLHDVGRPARRTSRGNGGKHGGVVADKIHVDDTHTTRVSTGKKNNLLAHTPEGEEAVHCLSDLTATTRRSITVVVVPPSDQHPVRLSHRRGRLEDASHQIHKAHLLIRQRAEAAPTPADHHRLHPRS